MGTNTDPVSEFFIEWFRRYISGLKFFFSIFVAIFVYSFLLVSFLIKKSINILGKNEEQKTNTLFNNYPKEILKHLIDLGCAFTATGLISAKILKQDRSALDQAISFCVGAIAENYSKNLMQLSMNGHIHLTAVSDKLKKYYETGQISKFAYESTISILGSCLNPNKTSEEKEVLESLIKQNYLEGDKLVYIFE